MKKLEQNVALIIGGMKIWNPKILNEINLKLINNSLKGIWFFEKNRLCYTNINQVATKRNNLLLK